MRVLDPIAIDGPAASGKTTVGKILSKMSGRYFLDTGLMYRYVAWKLSKEIGRIPEEIGKHLKTIKDEEFYSLLLSPEEDVEEWEKRVGFLLDPEVSRMASMVATRREVRDFLNEIQRNIASKFPLVVIGRDATTVVFKDSKCKFFLDAPLEERVRRRVNQLRAMGLEVDEEKIAKELKERDIRDSTREVAPLKLGEDVVRIDTANLTPQEVAEKIIERCRRFYSYSHRS